MGDYWLLLAFIPLVGLAVFLLLSRRERKGGLFVSTISFFSKSSFSLRAFLAPLPVIVKFCALGLIILALARPQKVNERSEQNVKGIDIMIVMDVSASMLEEDMGFQVTRLEAAKAVVSDFIRGRISDRIGLIVFSGESYTRVPLTLDYKILLDNLSRLNVVPSYQLRPRTAIGVALVNAATRLRHSPEKSRVVVFLTDGANNAGSIDPLTALKIVQKENIKVYIVGLGRQDGRMLVQHPVNEELMRQMAQSTDGKFFMAQNLSNLQSIFSEIDSLEKREITVNKWTEYNEKFSDYLKPAVFLYVLALLLSLTVFFRGV